MSNLPLANGHMLVVGVRLVFRYAHACRGTSWAQDFTSAVMDVDYSPTGREFVAGSYDRSVRIFGHTGGRSREARIEMHSITEILGAVDEPLITC